MCRIKILSLFCCLLSLVGCSNALTVQIISDGEMTADYKTGTAPENAPEIPGYIAAAANDRLTLYYEPDGLCIKILDNTTGELLSSAAEPDEDSSDTWKNFVNSAVILEYYRGRSTVISRVNLYSGSPEKKVTITENGFAASLRFPTVGFSLTMLAELTDTGITVSVPECSIEEINNENRLAAVWLYPFLGYTHLGDTAGYMFIPDGCGALISLTDYNGRFSQPYRAKIYGQNYSVEENTAGVQQFENSIASMSDPASVSAPVFGMVHTDRKIGFLGIVEEGCSNAEIYAYPNGVVMDYNWITARYVYREVYLYPTSATSGINSVQEERETFDIRVRYELVTGDNADYTGLAVKYRDYLTEKNVLKPGNANNYDLRLDFFAGDVQSALFGTDFVKMTSVDEMQEILDSIVSGGADRITAVYKGWQKNGIYGRLRFSSIAGALGTKTQLNALSNKYDGVNLLLYGDFLNSYIRGTVSDYIYRYNGKLFAEDSLLSLHPTRWRYHAAAAAKLMDKAAKSDAPGIAVDGVTDELYAYAVNNRTDMVSRKRAANEIITAVEKLSLAKNTALYAPNDYLWGNTERYFDLPLYGSDYKFTADEIPFFAIVLRGSMNLYGEYVNFKADSTEYLLRMIESGVNPSFLLTYASPTELLYTDSNSIFSSDWREYRELILSYDEIFRSLDAAVGDAQIIGHSRENGLGVTKYSNGSLIYVNYNSKPVTVNNITVPARSYLIEAGDGL